MHTKLSKFHIGWRTLKTAIAVIISMVIVDFYGTTSSKLIFAMLGAMAAMEPTFVESVESCLTQIVGVLFGSVVGIVLLALPLSQLAATGIGIILVITLYNLLQIRFSPSLPCFIVVMLCTTPDIAPVSYALGRIWDTTIGLAVGMIINILVFPYDNSRQIRYMIESLDQDLIQYFEEIFDGDEILPDTANLERKIKNMARQLSIFSNQRLLLHLKRQNRELEILRECESKARDLLGQMMVLCRMERIGRLNDTNRARIQKLGANIRDHRPLDAVMERDVVTNYHVQQILSLRRALLSVLKQ